MKFKKLLFLGLLFILCGCEAEYNLNISDDYLETIKVYATNDEEKDSFINHYSNYKYTASIYDSYDPEEDAPEEYDYYNIDLLDGQNLIAKYKFSSDYPTSRAVNKCYSSFAFFENENIRINTLGYFDCFDTYPTLDKVTININVPYEVVNHNADSVNETVYTWTIYRDMGRAVNLEFKNPNYDKEGKELPIDDKTKNENKDDKHVTSKEETKKTSKKENKQSSTLILVLLTGLFFVILFVIIFFKKRLEL